MPYPPSSSVIRYLRLGAKSYVLTVHTISGKRGPRYLQGRCRCDLGRAELETAEHVETVETTCHSFRYSIIIIEKLGPNGVYRRSIEEVFNVRTSRLDRVCFAPWPCYVLALE